MERRSASNYVMAPEEVVRLLYLHLLGREPDPAGLEGWSNLIVQHNDPTFAMKGILESEEYRIRNQPKDRSVLETLAAQVLAVLNRAPRIVDVGAQTLGLGTHPYDALMRYCPVEIIGFDPLQDKLALRAEAEGSQNLTLLPYAVGDGGRHILHINNDDATSSLFPLNREGNQHFNHLSELRTVRTEPMETRRLDDLLLGQPIDYLKIDVQGGELLVLQGAENTLKNTASIHCEVEFYPIYEGQPLFSDIFSFLVSRGFYFVDFKNVGLGRYTCLNSRKIESQDMMLWADSLFFREDADKEMRAAQALIAAVIYDKPSLAAYLLDR
jgi:FkbM family methyltransferase